MLAFATEPIPHDEAAKLIADKPTLTRDVFDQLPAELQARAFTISGIESFDVLQAVRDRIADLPQGANWDEVKKDVIAELSPWLNEEAANKRAELLMRHHAFSAYSAAQAREMDAMADVFPYRQYISTEDAQVRPTHASLNGLILPAKHPFWQNHTPPWEWNCRCDVVELTELDYDEEKFRDKKRRIDQRRILEGPALDKLEKEDKLIRGVGNIVDTRTPKQRGGKFEINVRHLTLPYSQIKKRWDTKTRSEFESWADGVELEGKGNSLLGWLTGKVKKAKRRILPTKLPGSAKGTPVSVHLFPADRTTKKEQEMINKTLAALDSVHGDGPLSEMRVRFAAGSKGHYRRHNPQIEKMGVSSPAALAIFKMRPQVRGEIKIGKSGKWPEVQILHEIGHKIDLEGRGERKFESVSGGDFDAIMSAIRRSSAFADINDKDNPFYKGGESYRSYHLKDYELFARAYAQWIAVESGDKDLQRSIQERRGPTSGYGKASQWATDDFEPIRKEFKAAFQKKGWMKK